MTKLASSLYRVRNPSRNQELSTHTARAESFVTRFVGLMGRARLAPSEGLHIVPCNSIHTFFMRFPIDIAFLSKEGTVVKVIHALRPWGMSAIYFKAHSVLELPAGTLQATQTQEGDRLTFEIASAALTPPK